MSASFGSDTVSDDVAKPASWQSEALLADQRLTGPLVRLLRAPGSLTASLQAGAGDEFSVQVLRQERCRPADYPEHPLPVSEPEGLLREVYLCCHARAAVFAQTVVPAATLSAHPWLGELGDQPLGLRLFVREDVARSPFEYALLDAGNVLARAAGAGLSEKDGGHGPLWARRSLFVVGEHPVSVNEVFFPAVLRCLA